MEDKSFQEAIEQRTKSLNSELEEQINQSVNTYVQGLGHPEGKTFKQICEHIKNKDIRNAVRRISTYVYLATLIAMNRDHGIISQEQSDELIAFLDLAEKQRDSQ